MGGAVIGFEPLVIVSSQAILGAGQFVGSRAAFYKRCHDRVKCLFDIGGVLFGDSRDVEIEERRVKTPVKAAGYLCGQSKIINQRLIQAT